MRSELMAQLPYQQAAEFTVFVLFQPLKLTFCLQSPVRNSGPNSRQFIKCPNYCRVNRVNRVGRVDRVFRVGRVGRVLGLVGLVEFLSFWVLLTFDINWSVCKFSRCRWGLAHVIPARFPASAGTSLAGIHFCIPGWMPDRRCIRA